MLILKGLSGLVPKKKIPCFSLFLAPKTVPRDHISKDINLVIHSLTQLVKGKTPPRVLRCALPD